MKRIFVSILAGVGMLLLGSTGLYAAHSDHGCHSCHVPHKALDPADPDGSWGVPLWSPAQTSDGLPVFDLYSSPSFDALGTDIGQPDGASKLCLGCHDGSYIVFGFIPDTTAVFEVGDLAKSHPVSFTYDPALATAAGELYNPEVRLSGLGGTIQEDLLDEMDKMQCSACHDVHVQGIGDYILRYDIGEENDEDHLLCRVCHEK